MNHAQILILAPDPEGCERLRSLVRDEGYEVAVTNSVQSVLDSIIGDTPSLILVSEDLGSGVEGSDVAARLAKAREGRHCPILMYSELPATAERIDRALSAGCDHYLGRTEMGALGSILRRTLASRASVEALESRRLSEPSPEPQMAPVAAPTQGSSSIGTPGAPQPEPQSTRPTDAVQPTQGRLRPEAWIGQSPGACAIRRDLLRLAESGASPVLVYTPKGAGKRLLARILHDTGRSSGSLERFHCDGRSESDLRAVLFGDATRGEPGLYQKARRGTIHLEAIEGLAPEAQRVLLDVLQSGVVPGTSHRIEARWVASTSEDLQQRVQQGLFDGELYAALAAHRIEARALRERSEDIGDLVRYFLESYGLPRGITGVTPAAMSALHAYPWPGNVDELADCIEQACVRTTGSQVDLEHLTRPIRRRAARGEPGADPAAPLPSVTTVRNGFSFAQSAQGSDPGSSGSFGARPWEITDHDPIDLELYERKALLRALASCGGDKLATAKLLKVGKSTLYRKLKRLGITAAPGSAPR